MYEFCLLMAVLSGCALVGIIAVGLVERLDAKVVVSFAGRKGADRVEWVSPDGSFGVVRLGGAGGSVGAAGRSAHRSKTGQRD